MDFNVEHKIFSRVITIKNDEMDTLKLHSHFENLLYVGRSVLTNTSSRIQRLFLKKRCVYMNTCLRRKQVKALKL